MSSALRGWGCLILSAVGCAASVAPQARINDVSVRRELDTGYNVTAVDGKPVVRARGAYKTTVPMALVEPGAHTFSLAHRESKTQSELKAEVAPGVQYRIALRDDGSPTLVAEGIQASAADAPRPQSLQPAAVSESK